MQKEYDLFWLHESHPSVQVYLTLFIFTHDCLGDCGGVGGLCNLGEGVEIVDQTLRWSIWLELAKLSWDEQAGAACSSSVSHVLEKAVSEEMNDWDSKAQNILEGENSKHKVMVPNTTGT